MDIEEPEAATPSEAPPDAPVEVPPHAMSNTEFRLRKLSGRKEAYDGLLVAVGRAWVSRDTRLHLFAARFLDFAVLTPEHLVLCSTGFFTRKPRRRVFREALGRLDVTPMGPEPMHTVRVAGPFSRPIRLELRPNEAGITFARELLACTNRNASARTAYYSLPPAEGAQPEADTAAEASGDEAAPS